MTKIRCPSCKTWVAPKVGYCPMCEAKIGNIISDNQFQDETENTVKSNQTYQKSENNHSKNNTPNQLPRANEEAFIVAKKLRRNAIIAATLAAIIMPWPGIFMFVRVRSAIKKNKKDIYNTQALKEEIRNAIAFSVFAIFFWIVIMNSGVFN